MLRSRRGAGPNGTSTGGPGAPQGPTPTSAGHTAPSHPGFRAMQLLGVVVVAMTLTLWAGLQSQGRSSKDQSFFEVWSSKSKSSSLSSLSSSRESYLLPSEDSPIAWTLHRYDQHEATYEETFNPAYPCDMNPDERVLLPPRLVPLLWFRTEISTSLNILLMGDSVAMQIGELLQEAMGIQSEERKLLRILEDEDPEHESLFWAAPQRVRPSQTTSLTTKHQFGLGGAGGWRILHWWLNENHGKPLPEATGGGWLLRDAKALRQAIEESQEGQESPTTTTTTTTRRGDIDVLVFRVSQPWMRWSTMTKDNMHETVRLAHKLLRAKVVVFLTIPFSNNIIEAEDLHNLKKTNRMIKEFAETYLDDEEHRVPGVTVMALDMGRFNDALIRENSYELGFPTKRNDENDYSYAQNILFQPAPYFARHIAHICGGNRVPTGSRDCRRYNRITCDGQHLCMKSFGGRLFAGMACVIQCAYQYGSSSDSVELQVCQRECNDQYMSLARIDDSFFSS